MAAGYKRRGEVGSNAGEARWTAGDKSPAFNRRCVTRLAGVWRDVVVSSDVGRVMNHGSGRLAGDVTLPQKVAFLSMPSSFPDTPRGVEARETRMSWVFLTDHFAYKLKKPVTTRHFDFATPALRRVYCEEEVRLNARLAQGIYLGVLPLVRAPEGRLRVGGEGEVVDWLIQMRRLPEAQMLDAAIRNGTVRPADIETVADRLVAFYASTEPVPLAEPDYLSRFVEEQALNRQSLRDRRFSLDEAAVEAVLAPVETALRELRGLLISRLAAGRIVEGHGDLRPEHIYLGQPPAAIDCLEFSRKLRLLDPFEELAFLGMECAVRGAAWIGPLLLARCAARLADPVPDRLTAFYAAFRAAMRARQAVDHLLDPKPREPGKWLPLARRYLAVGAEAAVRLRAPANR